MKSNIILAVLLTASLFFPGLVHADIDVLLYIQGPGDSILVDTSLVVPETCTVVDNVGASHDITEHKAPCAIVAAKDAGLIADFEFKDFGGSLGLFLKGINGIVDGPAPDFPFWNLWHNAVHSSVGISQIALFGGDVFQLTYGPWKTAIAQPGPGGPSGSEAPSVILPPDAERMIAFLAENQGDDGSFENALFTDWAAVAFGAFDPSHPGAKALRAYLKANPDPGSSLGSPVLSFERRAMAFMALGIDPYTGTSINYIEKIVEAYDGEQLGDKNLVNDDIFALLVLRKAGYGEENEMIQNITIFIQSKQEPNGSFGSIDMTAAAAQSLETVPSLQEVQNTVDAAKTYLRFKLHEDGGFGNPDSTSWVMQAISVFKEDWKSWDRGGRAPGDYLASLQKEDGSIDSAAPVWSTAYAVPAALEKPWGAVLHNFERPEPVLSKTQEEQALGEPEIVVEVALLEEQVSEHEASKEELLFEIEQELALIEERLAVLELQVGLVYAEYRLAQAQEQLALLENGETLIAESKEDKEDKEQEEPFVFSPEQFAAAAAQDQNSNSPLSTFMGQGIIALLVGAALFFVLGGAGAVSRYVLRYFEAYNLK